MTAAVGNSNLPAWLKSDADTSVAISSRIRLARNVSGIRFPSEASQEDLSGIFSRTEDFRNSQSDWTFLRLESLDEIQRSRLMERNLISLEAAANPQNMGLAFSASEISSLVVNEEDHCRLQIIQSGLNLDAALQHAQQLDRALHVFFKWAVHPTLGFLTAYPTNAGTGLRASVMVHLPALCLTREIIQVLQAVLHVGLAVRGFYGDGVDVHSAFFQICNQVTLGRTEEEIVKHLSGVIRQLGEKEQRAREKLLQEQPVLLEDKIGRALSTLSGCRILTLAEGMDLLSSLRLGLDTRLLGRIDSGTLLELFWEIQPAHLQAREKKPLGPDEQSEKRAEIIRRRLKLKRLKF